ncbi:MAG: four helix bundle protein [Patescibacteria group bacterium]
MGNSSEVVLENSVSVFMIKKFEDLTVYQKAFTLSLELYRITKNFPDEEKFGLTNQIRRAAVSVVSNIAEGSMRLNSLEFRQFVGIARGSVGELRSQISIAQALGFVEVEKADQLFVLLDEIGKMLTVLARSLKAKAAASNTNTND